ncbi:uncharacterized protein LOC122802053 [Protopterus annectens]|uniref:uncharacterized protein LOC122802053 n=1 Tax=Protopterus annectens TaxID=7888 RepID=UPI001CFB6647|nr:uncharacterized protein LOC122802053 [Protopterus annectens]
MHMFSGHSSQYKFLQDMPDLRTLVNCSADEWLQYICNPCILDLLFTHVNEYMPMNNVVFRDPVIPSFFSVAVDMAFQGHSSRQGYQFEPTYRPGEPRRKRRMRSSNDSEEPTVQPEGYSLEDMQWCLCGHCTIMTTERECHCCASSPRAIEKWRQLNSGSESNTCITFHPQFETACLLPHVLELLYRYHCMLRGRYRHAQWTNRLYRLFAYRAYVLWVHNNRKLGFGNRMILPACVVARIRAEFPAEEDDCYTGFQPFEGLWIFSEH